MKIQVDSIEWFPKGKKKFLHRLKAMWKCLTCKQFIIISRENDKQEKFDVYYHNIKTIGAGYVMKQIGEQMYDSATFKSHGNQNN